MHVLDVRSVFDCAHSSTSTAITTKHTNATKATKKRHKSTKNIIGISSIERTFQKTNNTNDSEPKCKKALSKNNSEVSITKNNLSKKTTGSNVWTQAVQIVHDTQNVVMMAVILVFIYLFCYDRTVRT